MYIHRKMGEKQKITYLTIKDLKELGILKKGRKKGKKRYRYYYDKNNNLIRSSSNHMLGGATNMASNPLREMQNNIDIRNVEQINDSNRFKIALDNKISSITDVQNADRKRNNEFITNAENLYNTNIVPLMQSNQPKGYKRGDGIDVSIGEGSDNFHNMNSKSRFNTYANSLQYNPIPNDEPTNLPFINRFGWKTQQPNNDMSFENHMGQTEAKLKADLEDLRSEQPEAKADSYHHIDRIPTNNNRATIAETMKYIEWYKELGGRDSYIINDLSGRTNVAKAIVKILKKEYKELGGQDISILNYTGTNANKMDNAVKKLKHYSKETPF